MKYKYYLRDTKSPRNLEKCVKSILDAGKIRINLHDHRRIPVSGKTFKKYSSGDLVSLIVGEMVITVARN